jgi:Tfp pilus assembly protein PilX
MSSGAFRNGSALVTCTIVLVIVSALAVSLASISGVNLQIADNQQEANRAFASAESGLEVMRYWLSRVKIPSTTEPSQYLSAVIAAAQADLQESAVVNFRVNTDGSIPVVMLDTTTGQNFRGQWSSTSDPKILKATIMGASGGMSRTITVNFHIEPYHFPIFNYGMATKGPIYFPGNPTLTGATQDWEADIYIESSGSTVALQVDGNAKLDGDITIGNPNALVDFQGDVQIGGDSGQTAVDEHVDTVDDPEDMPEFPVPDISHFRPYATGPVINSGIDLSGTTTWTNAVIAAGTNPTFEGNTTFQGILYIEAPNIVTFGGNVTLQGMIVADGDPANPGTNLISFGDPNSSKPSNFASGPYPPGSQFDAIRSEQGSCILAPGFEVAFVKNFSAVNGVIAASGLSFAWNASATVNGTLINYSDKPTVVEGNISMNFDRASMVEIPAGFDLYRVPIYNPNSYALAF